jgi:Heterokaryon incompatibility protein (HET)
MNATKMYKYGPLDETKKEIRLLKFHPGGTSFLVWELHIASLNDKPDYLALSHAWQRGEPNRAVEIEGRIFLVTESVYLMLSHLQRRFPGESFWIDAICINQQSITEKNQQVPLMTEIFSTAKTVVIWLGNDTPGAELACSFLRRAATTLQPSNTETPDNYTSFISLANELNISSTQLEELVRGLCNFLERPWFYRTWIIQEMVLPEANPIILYGNVEFEWDESIVMGVSRLIPIVSAPEILETERELYASKDMIRLKDLAGWGTGGGVFRSLYVLRCCYHFPSEGIWTKQQRPREGLPLEMVVIEAMFSLATDPRDKLHGLLGLLAEEDRQSIIVDYNRTASEVYQSFVQYWIQSQKDLRILSHVLWCRPKNHTLIYPSWVPDFNGVVRENDPNLLIRTVDPRGGYFRTTLDIPPTVKFDKPGVLSAKGILLDTVRATVSPDRSNIDGTKVLNLEELLHLFYTAGKRCRVCEICSDNFTDSCPYPVYLPWRSRRPIRMTEAIWRAFIGDFELTGGGYQIEAQVPVSQAYGEAFSHWIHECAATKKFQLDAYLSHFPLEVGPHYDGVMSNLKKRIELMLKRRRGFTTSHWIGLGADAEIGDVVALLYGGDVPYLLRPREGGYFFVGECYIQGVMQGEVLRDMDRLDKKNEGYAEETWIDIV